MAEALRVDEQYAIVSETERAPLRVLKHGDTFAVFDPRGDIIQRPASEHGLYFAGTRFLSKIELLLGRREPLLLSSTISEDNTVFAADLTNPDEVRDGHVVVDRGLLHLFRSRVLWHGSCVERVRVSNHALHVMDTTITLRFDSDFADIFEVRGTRRARRGQRLPNTFAADGALLLRYRGLDGSERRIRIRSARPPDRIDEGLFEFAVSLDSHASAEIEISMACEIDEERHPLIRYGEVLAFVGNRLGARDQGECRVISSNESFNRWLRRSSADLEMMITDTPHGPYPYAGIPWFSAPFGRDGIITAMELLWAAPDVARGVLTFLAETQATTTSDAQDAQPGKIVHEMRRGEMAALGEIPFGQYYGTADATPLFVMLAHAYFERTGDLAFIDQLWPHILAALEWMDSSGDPDQDGFIEYARRGGTGLIQQGWKDSFDSIFHADGSLAEPPIAVCEIQGYAYGAWSGAARLAAARREPAEAERWRARADSLQRQFERAFWCEDLRTYALALDGSARPIPAIVSSPGSPAPITPG
jgi:glycogen debranching enzyme